ncbi:unnamed protein product [Adineta steineri]|uniref:Uncharacterized protein n=1 Tax=Adineta steineri TaxID=433720 RepID=A0A814Z998_9BILA|nr:unnamed protein product [Adineta steineri]
MAVTSSHNYDGYPFQSFFDIFKQNKNHHNDKKFIEQQSYYQTTYIPNTRYSNNTYNHYRQPDVNSTSLLHSNQLDDPYQSQQTWPYINNTYKHQEKYFDNSFLLSTYTETIPKTYNKPPVVQYEREIQYPPHPVFGNTGFAGIESSEDSGYNYNSNSKYRSMPNAGLANFRNVSSLPPKIRVIFIPQASSQLQQPCANSLNVPPFLFSRMTQPLCSLPLPPPLPQISTLPLTPAVQQRVIQQYSNPVATFPFTPNWQSPQSFAPTYPPPLQQPSMMPMPSFQAPQYDSQPYFPSAVPPKNMSMLSSNTSPLLPYSNPVSSVPQLPNNNYSNICRACVPSPPLNVTVTDHSKFQKCSTCHHIPTDGSNPNVQLSNDRSTQLLHHPAIQQHYPRTNTYMTKFTWPHKLPPLPPGAVIISDEYIKKRDTSYDSYFYSKRKYPQYGQDTMKTAVESDKSAIMNKTNHRKQSNDKASPSFSSGASSHSLLFRSASRRSLPSLYSWTPRGSRQPTGHYWHESPICHSFTSSKYSSDNAFMDKSNKYQIDVTNSYKRKRNIDYNKLFDGTPTRKIRIIYEPYTSHWTSHMNHQLKSNDNNPYSWSISSAISNIHPIFANKNNPIKQTSPAYKMFPLQEEQEEEEEEENKKSIRASSSSSLESKQSTENLSTRSTCDVSYNSIVNNKKRDSVSTTSTSTDSSNFKQIKLLY